MSLAGLVGTIVWLEDAFDRVGASRSYGGAIAYNYYGPPRLTQDVDVLVLVEGPALGSLAKALAEAGCRRESPEPGPLDPQAFLADLRGKAHFASLVKDGVRVELFAPWHPFHRRVLERSPRRELGGRSIAIHAAEDLIVFKKIFDRPKDIQDIKAMLLSRKGLLDTKRLLEDARELLPAAGWGELKELVESFS